MPLTWQDGVSDIQDVPESLKWNKHVILSQNAVNLLLYLLKEYSPELGETSLIEEISHRLRIAQQVGKE